MKNIPFYKQETKYTCGAVCARMVLAKLGIKKSEKQIAKILNTNKRSGTKNKHFPRIAEEYKLNYIVKRNSNLRTLKRYKRKRYLLIVTYKPLEYKSGHFAVIKKIDKDYIYLLDPTFGPDHRINIDYFNDMWDSDEKAWFFGIKLRTKTSQKTD